MSGTGGKREFKQDPNLSMRELNDVLGDQLSHVVVRLLVCHSYYKFYCLYVNIICLINPTNVTEHLLS